MNIILLIALWIGILALVGLAFNLIIVTLVTIITIPVALINRWKESQRLKKMTRLKNQAVQELIKMVVKEKIIKTENENADKAYNSGVKKASTKRPVKK
jgi:hypothetical protein